MGHLVNHAVVRVRIPKWVSWKDPELGFEVLNSGSLWDPGMQMFSKQLGEGSESEAQERG